MQPGSYYHIYNRGNNREVIFREIENYYFFLGRYQKYLGNLVDTYAYCLMPNHFHFLIRVKGEAQEYKSLEDFCTLPRQPPRYLTPLQQAFRDFFISYARSFNNRYSRTGSLFQYKFKRRIADDIPYRLRLVTYIHNNPVVAGLVHQPGDWTFSSYRAILAKNTTALKREAVLNWFDGRASFIAAHQNFYNWEG